MRPPYISLDDEKKRCVIFSESDMKCLVRTMYSTFGSGAQFVLWFLGKDIATRCTTTSASYIKDPLALVDFCFEKRKMLGLADFELKELAPLPPSEGREPEGAPEGGEEGALKLKEAGKSGEGALEEEEAGGGTVMYPKTVVVRSSVECEILNVADARYPSALIKGYITGALEAAYLRDFEVTEKRCIRRGDPHCEFEVKPEEKEEKAASAA